MTGVTRFGHEHEPAVSASVSPGGGPRLRYSKDEQAVDFSPYEWLLTADCLNATKAAFEVREGCEAAEGRN
jgi:hypothetical protein